MTIEAFDRTPGAQNTQHLQEAAISADPLVLKQYYEEQRGNPNERNPSQVR